MSRTVYLVWFLCCLEKFQTLDGETSKCHARDHQITKRTHWKFYIKLFIVVSIFPIFSLFQPLKTFWASDIITLFGINACTTATTQGSPLKLNETEIKEVKDMADSQSTAMRRWLYISGIKCLMYLRNNSFANFGHQELTLYLWKLSLTIFQVFIYPNVRYLEMKSVQDLEKH